MKTFSSLEIGMNLPKADSNETHLANLVEYQKINLEMSGFIRDWPPKGKFLKSDIDLKNPKRMNK